ncbi:hypothetical protein [Sphingobacterium endophyticum]|uniref:hypothetical protein n=1 Tax=Sphingobacterium endophyticum TaxID=2546448 RepID=UPI0012E24E35|nr:hypothetical protein [Sphingobacterium endophyticum]
MFLEKLKNVLSLNGVSLIIGVGGIFTTIFSYIVTDYNSVLNVKWFLLALYIFLVILMFSFKLTYDIYQEYKNVVKNPVDEIKDHSKGISFETNEEVLLVENNPILNHSAMVTIFYLKEDVEIPIGLGYVSNIQSKFTHITILELDVKFSTNYPEELKKMRFNDNNTIKKIIVKYYIMHNR